MTSNSLRDLAKRPEAGQKTGQKTRPVLHLQSEDHSEDDADSSFGTATISKSKTQTKTPPLYRVILMNDDYMSSPRSS